MCTYEGARFVGEQLDSILGQDRAPDEVVICDDCSTDGTPDLVCERAARSAVPVRLYRNPERLGTARNVEQAIGLCGGDVIALADQDDVWRTHKLARLLDALGGPPFPGLVFSDGDLIDERSEPLGRTCWDLIRLTAEHLEALNGPRPFEVLFERQLALGGTVTGGTMAFRAEHRARVLPFPAWLPPAGKAAVIHDGWIALVVSAAAPVRAVPDRLIGYRSHADQQLGLVERREATRPAMARVALRSLWRADGVPKENELLWLSTLLDRLQSHRAHVSPDAVRLVAERVRHFSVRCQLPERRLRRLPPIARELTSGGYRRYSSGALSAVRDLLRS